MDVLVLNLGQNYSDSSCLIWILTNLLVWLDSAPSCTIFAMFEHLDAVSQCIHPTRASACAPSMPKLFLSPLKFHLWHKPSFFSLARDTKPTLGDQASCPLPVIHTAWVHCSILIQQEMCLCNSLGTVHIQINMF